MDFIVEQPWYSMENVPKDGSVIFMRIRKTGEVARVKWEYIQHDEFDLPEYAWVSMGYMSVPAWFDDDDLEWRFA